MLLPTSAVANSSLITAAGDIKDTVICLCLLPVGLLQLPACRSARLRHSSTTVSSECCFMLIQLVSKYDSVTPVLCDFLHLLPIKEQINFSFKIGVLTYEALNGLVMLNFPEVLGTVAVNPTLSLNRSADCGDLTVPRAKNTSYGERSFAIAAPTLWNNFLVELCRSSLMIYFFATDLRLIYLGQHITWLCQ